VYTFRAQREVTHSVAAGGLQCRRRLSHHGTRLLRWESGGAGQRAQVRAGDGPGDDVGGRLVGADVQDGDQSVVVDERGAACRVQHVGDLRPRGRQDQDVDVSLQREVASATFLYATDGRLERLAELIAFPEDGALRVGVVRALIQCRP